MQISQWKADISGDCFQMPANQAEVPEFLKRHNIKADCILSTYHCGYKRGDFGLAGTKMLGTHGSQAHLALLTLLTLYGFNEDDIAAFKRPVSSTQLVNGQPHTHAKFGLKEVLLD